jgi:hypothetical protein
MIGEQMKNLMTEIVVNIFRTNFNAVKEKKNER